MGGALATLLPGIYRRGNTLDELNSLIKALLLPLLRFSSMLNFCRIPNGHFMLLHLNSGEKFFLLTLIVFLYSKNAQYKSKGVYYG